MELAVSFLAGCLNRQKDFSPQNHYHALLKKELSESFPLDFRFSFSTYHAYGQLTGIVQNQILNTRPDLFVILIRPFPFYILSKPLIKYERADGTLTRAIHPALFARSRKEWPEKYYVQIKDASPPPLDIRPQFGLHDLNLLAGILSGLHLWAQGFVRQEADKIITLCKKEKIGLMFLGMPQNHNTVFGPSLGSFVNKRLSSAISGNGISYVDISGKSDNTGKSYFYPDGIHFSETGHHYIKDQLLPVFTEFIRKRNGFLQHPGV